MLKRYSSLKNCCELGTKMGKDQGKYNGDADQEK
jgi:hypothetical protein